MSEQWFVKMKSLAEKAIDVVKNEDIKFYPKRWTKTYYHWMENIQDWCISRQLMWGHQIPVWYSNDELYVGKDPPKNGTWEQDPDVLDTCFLLGFGPLQH